MHPSLKPLKRCLLALGLALGACNVFNPSGEGDGGDSVDAHLTEGESKFRQMDYPAAMAAFQKALSADSTNSLAYYGYAKATMRYYQLSPATLLKEVSKAQEGTAIPFLTSSDFDLTNYLQATSKVRKALGTLTARDTLTRWFNYLSDSTSIGAKKDKYRAQRVAFIKDYFRKADLNMPGYFKKAKFPLSDLKLRYEQVVADFGFVELVYAVAHLRDLNADDMITEDDDLLKKLSFNMGGGAGGGFKVDNLEDIQEELLADTVAQKNMNQLIQNVASGLNSAGTVLDLIGPVLEQQKQQVPGGDTLAGDEGLTETVSKNMDSVVTSLGTAVTFYQFGDGLDNDGDGCLDEEYMDGKDNDDDGFTDEDARLLPPDAADNDMNGISGFSDPAELTNASTGKLLFVEAAGFTKGANYKSKDIKIWVQKDSLEFRLRKNGALDEGQKAVLDSAKKAIGGCWNNYK